MEPGNEIRLLLVLNNPLELEGKPGKFIHGALQIRQTAITHSLAISVLSESTTS